MHNLLRSLILYCLIATGAYAETVKEIAEKAHLANINALLIFTAQEGINSGHYRFTEVDVEMDVIHLPFTYQLASEHERINYFVVGNVGYSRTYLSEDIEIPPERHLDYDNHLRTYTAGLGGGIRYKAMEDSYLSGGIELIYSRSGASVKKPDDDIGDAIEDFFNKNYNDNISYRFFADAEYRPDGYRFKPYAKISFNLYETKSTFDFDELASFKSQSSVTRVSLGAETPKLLYNNGNYLTLEGYIGGNYLGGEVTHSVQFDSYGTVGAVAYWYTPGTPAWAERFFLEVSSVRSNGLEGYNVGVGFTLDF